MKLWLDWQNAGQIRQCELDLAQRCAQRLDVVDGFLTIWPNAVIELIHLKAMPVILTADEECDVQIAGVG